VLEVCKNSVDETSADLIVTTAHKAKGREWTSVRIANDFRPSEETSDLPSVSELRLFYVAVTRAIHKLDADAFTWIHDLTSAPQGDREAIAA
jgi:superfamily I DNA/RNA helicase